ncbi:hypothetical protein LEP1GSC193_2652 [Leptospira alstonii serovar Pingchang str. 80-412]|uniref:Uncharacterized protein n=2 Tax=Leptospira alstonii TaxID=28452 RepID=M6CR58_9LEPT|nr:hypothetical protein LEP1GSC194_0210 [Leptospira alstonii serovar Sichuan str. 79601]EQA79267.1 hypothetical protein LEP1GSC193_2652 [Leptospira alstonii serovar Pingchang str. 80-412]
MSPSCKESNFLPSKKWETILKNRFPLPTSLGIQTIYLENELRFKIEFV